MTIVTKTGDKGTTGLFGGQRVPKDDPRIHAYGDVDELNATLGWVAAQPDVSDALKEHVLRVQNVLFRMGADLATPIADNKAEVPRMEQAQVEEIEGWIAELEPTLAPQRSFILPGGTATASILHLARTIARRAERWTVSLAQKEEIGPYVVMYLNRLSDWLFLAARQANKDARKEDVKVTYE